MFKSNNPVVVIIDTGIDVNNTVFNDRIKDGVYIETINNSQFYVESYKSNKDCIDDDIGHGTAIAGIIHLHCPESNFIIIKIFNSENVCSSESKLIYALEYAVNNYDFDIINLSLGIPATSHNSKLNNICDYLYANDKIVISAFDNNGSISFPAAFENVYGVTNGMNCRSIDDYYVVDNRNVNICAKGNRQMVHWKNGAKIYSSGNSYACAHFTGIIAKYLYSYDVGSNKELNNIIRNNSMGVIENKTTTIKNNIQSKPSVSKYRKACIFPFNKEMHSLVRFSNKLSFDLVDIYDIKYSARVGASAGNLLKTKLPKDYIIKSINDIDWDSIDTFILGHMDDQYYSMQNRVSREELVQEIVDHDKNLYSYDDVSDIINDDKYVSNHLYIPKVTKADVCPLPFGKLYKQDKPVLGVFGTSSMQGKFTLQLLIRYELLSRDYNIFQVGTEPSSLLFGFDLVFPCGYNSTVSIERDDVIYYLNKNIYEKARSSDLIIVGGQSGLIPREESNSSNFDFTQLEVLYGTLPDAAILCINSTDSYELVKRCMKFLESVSDSKILALVMYPYYYANDDIYGQKLLYMSEDVFLQRYKESWECETGCPVFYINSQAQLFKLIDRIIDYFAQDT